MSCSSRSMRTVTRSTPRLSIIIATYNAAQKLEHALRSIIQQDFDSWELLIADGGSIDSTVDLIRQYEMQIAWWRSAEDLGIYDAWNKALPHARGEYVCFLGADDAFENTGVLSRLFAAVGPNQYDLVTSRGVILDPRAGKTSEVGSEWEYQRIGRRMIVCHPGLFHRRALFDQYGEFDTRYKIAGDLEFLLRMPPGMRTLHVNTTSVVIEGSGVSRMHVLRRLREQREILARCPRYGPVRAYLAWLDKLWRLPIARLLNIPH